MKNQDKTEYKLDLFEDEAQSMQIEGLNHPTKPTVVKFIEKPENYCTSPCAVFGKCGGCDLLCLKYNSQLELKQKLIENLFAYSLNGVKVEQIEGLYYPYKYRNKVHFSAGMIKGVTELGFLEEKSNKLVSVSQCLMHDEWCKILLEELKNYIKHSKIRAYSSETETGSLRYVVARCVDNNLLLTLVVTDSMILGLKHLYNALKEKFNEVSIYININNAKNSLVFSPNFIHKEGVKEITGTLNGVIYKLSPKSFLQVNSKLTSKIYNKVVELLNINKKTVVIDAFSGIGITSMLFAKAGASVVSIEIEKNAVNDARTLAKLNKLDGSIKMICEDATTAIPNVVAENNSPNTTLFVDPPRAGLTEDFIETIISSKIKSVIYLSCNPLTLLRDVKAFTKSGYRITYIKPYDMFPHTKHVETLVKIEKK